MTADELYQLGDKAYNEDRYDEALKYYTEAAPENVDAAASIPFCYVNYAAQISAEASSDPSNTERLVKGQQYAVKLLDTAIRVSLKLYRDYPDYPYVLNIAGSVIAQATNLQYSLVSTGLTTAYNITTTTTTVRKHIKETTVGGEVVSREVLWEEILGTETDSFVSLTSYDLSDYHILGPDEKTKRVKASLETIHQNTVELADILECVNREYDAHILRASLACAMAECQGGDRSMLLPAEWFICRAKELAKEALTDNEIYASWESLNEGVFDDYNELARKYAALLRSYRKQGQLPYISKFYANRDNAPAIESSATYAQSQIANTRADAHTGGKGDFFEVLLTVFAQVTFMKIFPTILFASIISLFCGGLFHVFSADAGAFTKVFGIVWFIVTMALTFFRTITDADEFRTNNTFKLYMGITLGTGLLFSINFFVGLIAYIVLNVLAKKYK